MFVLWHEKILIRGRERNESVVSRARGESHVFFFEISLSLFFCVCGQLNFSRAALKIARRLLSVAAARRKNVTVRVVCF